MAPTQCENCGLYFNSQNQLKNHKNKFCTDSKYAYIDHLQSKFREASKNRDISLYGKMSLAMQGQTYNLEKAQVTNNDNIDHQYRKILKEIEQEKNVKNRLQNEKQKAFRQLQALQKQEQQLVIQDKQNNLKDVIFRREQLARDQEQLKKQLNQFNNKKKQWEKSQVKEKQQVDRPYQQGIKAGKVKFEREMLQEKKHNLDLELNGKKRQRQKLQKQLLQMSAVQQINLSRAMNQKGTKSNVIFRPQQQKQYDYEPKLSNLGKKHFYQSNNSNQSNISSKLNHGILQGNQKILKFHLNTQGKSAQDRMIQQLKAQEYDDLQILSKLPKNSQIYNKKLKQYQQLSQKRMQIHQIAQKKRIQKMKRQFQFEKLSNTRERQNSQWVDQNRKALMNQQLGVLSGQNNQQFQSNYDQYQQNNTDEYPSNNNLSINEKIKPRTSINQSQLKPNISAMSKNKSPGSMVSRPAMNNLPLSGKPGLQSYPYDAPKQNKQKPKKQSSLFGYRISVLSLKNFSHKKAIKIKLLIYQQYYRKQQSGGMKYQFSTVYHDQRIDPNQAYNPQFKNKLDHTGAINYNQSFYVPQNLQQLYNTNQKQIYLIFIAAQKDQKRVTNQPKPYAWYNLKITHFGNIREGRFTFNLYGDDIIYPIPADMNKMKKKKQEELTIQLQQVLLDQQMMKISSQQNSKHPHSDTKVPPEQTNKIPKSSDRENISIQDNLHPSMLQTNRLQSPENKDSLNGSKHNMNYPVKMKNIKLQDLQTNINQHYFYSNQKSTQFSHCTLRKPLNFDVSVAGLRTLPSYIGPVKLQITFLDADGAHILPKQQFLADIGTDLYNPLINYTRKIRNQTKIPPSTIVFIRMIALSALDYQVYSLGFSLIYLFLNKQGQTIKNNKTNDYFMTSGYYQLPIFLGNIQPKYIDIQQLLKQYPTIPCCSILIGILENASKISNPMPNYNQKIYNTILFQVDQNQVKLFQQQYKRQTIDTNTLISGYLQYKGIKKNYSGQQVNKYIYRTLTFTRQAIKGQLQLKWMAQYQQYFGINFILDKLIIPQTQLAYYYFVTICILPPANYYKSKSFDLNLIRKINFNQSKVTELIYNQNQLYMNPNYDRNTCLIIQVNRIQIFQSQNVQSNNNIQGYAYTIIPVFQIHQKIRSANIQKSTLKLYDGDFDANNIQILEKNVPKFIEKIAKSKKSDCQICFRLLNGYFMNQYHKYQSDAKTPLYKTLEGQNVQFQTALDEIGAVLSNNYNLQITW